MAFRHIFINFWALRLLSVLLSGNKTFLIERGIFAMWLISRRIIAICLFLDGFHHDPAKRRG